MSLIFDVGKSVAPDVFWLPSFLVDGNLPVMEISVSSRKFQQLMSLVDSFGSFDSFFFFQRSGGGGGGERGVQLCVLLLYLVWTVWMCMQWALNDYNNNYHYMCVGLRIFFFFFFSPSHICFLFYLSLFSS